MRNPIKSAAVSSSYALELSSDFLIPVATRYLLMTSCVTLAVVDCVLLRTALRVVYYLNARIRRIAVRRKTFARQLKRLERSRKLEGTKLKWKLLYPVLIFKINFLLHRIWLFSVHAVIFPPESACHLCVDGNCSWSFEHHRPLKS